MKVYINNKEVALLPGMTIRHAVIQAGLMKEIEAGKRVFDEWGNEVGLDGALAKGMKLYVR